jgi:hypothetical protein
LLLLLLLLLACRRVQHVEPFAFASMHKSYSNQIGAGLPRSGHSVQQTQSNAAVQIMECLLLGHCMS